MVVIEDEKSTFRGYFSLELYVNEVKGTLVVFLKRLFIKKMDDYFKFPV
jgi:hypothetical protein